MRRLAFLLVLAGCGNDFEPASLLDSLRVLAIQANPPEVAPGATATLQALVPDQSLGDAGAIHYHWTACLKPPPLGSGANVNVECLGNDAGADTVAELGEGDTATVTMPPLPSITQIVTQWDVTNGYYLPVVLHLLRGAEEVTAVYRLRYTLPLPLFGAPNTNPAISEVLLLPRTDGGAPFDLGGDLSGYALDDAAPPTVHKGDKLTLQAAATLGSDEPYTTVDVTDLSFDGGLSGLKTMMLTEQMQFAWFATAAHFSNPETGEAKPSTEFRLDKYLPDDATTIWLYVVIRDERGGVSWTRRTILYEP